MKAILFILLSTLSIAPIAWADSFTEKVNSIAAPLTEDVAVYSWRTPTSGANLVAKGTFTPELNQYFMAPMDPGTQRYGRGFYVAYSPLGSQSYAHDPQHVLVEVKVPKGTLFIDLMDPGTRKRIVKAGLTVEQIQAEYSGSAVIKVTNDWAVLRNIENTSIRAWDGSNVSLEKLDEIFKKMGRHPREILLRQARDSLRARGKGQAHLSIVRATKSVAEIVAELRDMPVVDSKSAAGLLETLDDPRVKSAILAHKALSQELLLKIAEHAEPDLLPKLIPKAAELDKSFLQYGLFKVLARAGTGENESKVLSAAFYEFGAEGVLNQFLLEAHMPNAEQVFRKIARMISLDNGDLAAFYEKMKLAPLPNGLAERLWRSSLPEIVSEVPFDLRFMTSKYLLLFQPNVSAEWENILKFCKTLKCVSRAVESWKEVLASLPEAQQSKAMAEAIKPFLSHVKTITTKEAKVKDYFKLFSFPGLSPADRSSIIASVISNGKIPQNPQWAKVAQGAQQMQLDGAWELAFVELMNKRGMQGSDWEELILHLQDPKAKQKALAHRIDSADSVWDLWKLSKHELSDETKIKFESRLMKLSRGIKSRGAYEMNAALYALKDVRWLRTQTKKEMAFNLTSIIGSMPEGVTEDSIKVLKDWVSLDDLKAMKSEILKNSLGSADLIRNLFFLGKEEAIPFLLPEIGPHVVEAVKVFQGKDVQMRLIGYWIDFTGKLEIIHGYSLRKKGSLNEALLKDLFDDVNRIIANRAKHGRDSQFLGDFPKSRTALELTTKMLLDAPPIRRDLLAKGWDSLVAAGALKTIPGKELEALLSRRASVDPVMSARSRATILKKGISENAIGFLAGELLRMPPQEMEKTLDQVQQSLGARQRLALRESALKLGREKPGLQSSARLLGELVITTGGDYLHVPDPFTPGNKMRQWLKTLSQSSYRTSYRVTGPVNTGDSIEVNKLTDTNNSVKELTHLIVNDSPEKLLQKLPYPEKSGNTLAGSVVSYYAQSLSFPERREFNKKILLSLSEALERGSDAQIATAARVIREYNVQERSILNLLIEALQRERLLMSALLPITQLELLRAIETQALMGPDEALKLVHAPTNSSQTAVVANARETILKKILKDDPRLAAALANPPPVSNSKPQVSSSPGVLKRCQDFFSSLK